MITLGICNAETASACCFKDGELIAAASEERFSRVKMDESFPIRSIEYVLGEAGVNLTDIDQVAYAWGKGFQEELLPTYVARAVELAEEDKTALDIFSERIRIETERDEANKNEFKGWFDEHFPAPGQPPLITCFHHEAHAYSACLLSPYQRALVLTADARGDYESVTCWLYDTASESVIRKIYSSTSSDSPGFFYGRITGLLGFKPCRHEGKITGLAAHGDPKNAIGLMQGMIDFEDGELKAKLGDLYRPFYTNYSDALKNEISRYSREDIAAAAQQHLEDLLCKIVIHVCEKHEIKDIPLVCAGGIFGNVKANQTLKELPHIKQMFIQPQMGDGGLCLGAAAYAQHSAGLKISPMTHVYLGPSIDVDEINKQPSDVLQKITVEQPENTADELVEDLSSGKVVGLVRGRMEFGPRALCYRSILYKTSDQSCNKLLNERLHRTEFMPFAPVTTTELAEKAFIGFLESDITFNFMTSTVNCTDEFSSKCSAVTHIDGTARPHVIRKDSDPFMWDVVSQWFEKTGEYALINTSFNTHEEPIICTVDDALKILLNGTIDVLYVESQRVSLK